MTVKQKLHLLIPLNTILVIALSLPSCNNWHNPKALRDLYSIEIYLPKGFVDENTQASVRHTLRWKRIMDISDQPLTRDTIIAPGWTYEISVLEREEK